VVGCAQAVERQQQHLDIGLQTGMSEYFSTELQRLASGMRPVGPGMKHGAAIAKAGNALAVQQVRVDAGDLGRGVGSQSHRAARKLVDQFERLQVECLASSGQQRLQMFEQRRHDQLVAIATGSVKQLAAEFFDVACLGGQHIGNVIRENPGGHGNLRLLKRRFYRAGRQAAEGPCRLTGAKIKHPAKVAPCCATSAGLFSTTCGGGRGSDAAGAVQGTEELGR